MERNGGSSSNNSKDIERRISHDEEVVDKSAYREFAAPFGVQFWEVTKRVFQQYWRTPSYLYSKIVLCTASVSLHTAFPRFSACLNYLSHSLCSLVSLF